MTESLFFGEVAAVAEDGDEPFFLTDGLNDLERKPLAASAARFSSLVGSTSSVLTVSECTGSDCRMASGSFLFNLRADMIQRYIKLHITATYYTTHYRYILQWKMLHSCNYNSRLE